MSSNQTETRPYIFNLETTKIELHFEKSEFDNLTDDMKRELKSAFLWSRKGQCWVSRAKEPNLWRAKQVAKKLGFIEEQREGERLSFGEQVEKTKERAEARADRYEDYAGNAAQRGEQMQKELSGYRGDITFFTQPNINSSAGRAFTNRREKIYARYHKGFEEYRKSDYFLSRAATARETAEATKYKDRAYLDRHIKECKKTVRSREKNIIKYEKILCALECGEQKTKYNGDPYTIEEVSAWIEREFELVEVAMDKQAYLENCLDELGGIQFNKENIKVGYIVSLRRDKEVEVIGTGPVNITYKILTGGAAGMTLTATYAEIHGIVKTVETKRTPHPFKVGETFTAKKHAYADDHSFKRTTVEVVYEVIKATDTTIQLRPVGTAIKPILRKPTKLHNGSWAFSIDDTYGNTFYKDEEGK